jgi:hypothetical protein
MFDFLTPQAIAEPALQFGGWLFGLYSHFRHEAIVMLWSVSPTWLKSVVIVVGATYAGLQLRTRIHRVVPHRARARD